MPKIKIETQSEKSLGIFYASQTGTAESFARDLAKKLGVGTCENIKNFSFQNCTDICLFLVATTGEGDPPDDARAFFKTLKNSRFEKNPEFAVFALGDMNYLNFCAAGKKADADIFKAGGKRLRRVALGDASQDIEEAFDLWAQEISHLLASARTPAAPHLEAPVVSASEAAPAKENAVFRVVKKIELRQKSSDLESTVELVLITENETEAARYGPGAVVEIFPENRAEDVDAVMGLMTVGEKYEQVKNFLTTQVDITGSPSAGDFRRIREALQETRAIEHAGKFPNLIACLQLLVDQGGKLEAETILPALPRLKPRSYSASGWPGIAVCVAFKALPFPGLCSEFLSMTVEAGHRLDGKIREGSEKLRALEKGDFREILFVCAGSGIAVFKGFLDFFAAKPARPEISLLFGCRDPEEDWLYSESVVDALDAGIIKNAWFAFSRATESKEYVQHKLHLAKPKELLANPEGGRVVICGSTAMCRDVLAEIRKSGVDVDALCERGLIVLEAFG